MSMAAGERAGARFLQQRTSASFMRTQLPSSAVPSNVTPSRGVATDHGHGLAEENISDDPLSPPKWREEHVDKTLLRYLVGRGGSTKAKLEKDNGVKLEIHSSHEAETRASVRISGSEVAVKAACMAMQKILDDAVQSKLQYTHFISLPLAVHPALVEKLTNFQQSILHSLQNDSHGATRSPELLEERSGAVRKGNNYITPQSRKSESSLNNHEADSSGIHKSIFIRPATFHLTILMLKLWNEERVQAASNVLQNIMPFVHDALEGQPIAVDLQGLECLKGTPEKAHVLYARIEDSKHKSRLLQACQVLIDAFVESGLVLEKDIGQSLKLHATLMNTAQRKVKQSVRSVKRVPFNATNILAKYGDWNWGEYAILEAHLSQRFVYDENGYYHCVSAIPFPQHASA